MNITNNTNLWEEKNSTEPKKNSENKNEFVIEDFTKPTEKKSVISECLDTERKWMRNCPKCGKSLNYTEKWVCDRANKQNRICKSCSNHNKVRGCLLESTKSILSKRKMGKRPTLSARLNMSKSQTGRKHSEETKLKMSGENNGMYNIHRYGTMNPFSGKKHSEESRRKMRLAAIERIKQRSSNGFLNNVNPKETEYFSKLEKEKGWDGFYYGKNQQHILEGLGYFLDYYEPNLNIVVEYDEPRHYVGGQLREKDVKRMNEIKKNLQCKFFRYDEKNKELKEYV